MYIGKWNPAPGTSRVMLWAALVAVAIALAAWWGARPVPVGAPAHTASTTAAAATSTTPAQSPKSAPVKPRALASVTTTIERLSDASRFISLFKSTGVAAKIAGKGPYTIFVPTNGAFGQLPAGAISKMTPAQKLRFVQYHVVVGRAIDPQAQVAGTIQALSGDMLNFSFGADKIPLVGSAIFIKKYQATNGVVYLIDNVLLPPQRAQ